MNRNNDHWAVDESTQKRLVEIYKGVQGVPFLSDVPDSVNLLHLQNLYGDMEEGQSFWEGIKGVLHNVRGGKDQGSTTLGEAQNQINFRFRGKPSQELLGKIRKSFKARFDELVDLGIMENIGRGRYKWLIQPTDAILMAEGANYSPNSLVRWNKLAVKIFRTPDFLDLDRSNGGKRQSNLVSNEKHVTREQMETGLKHYDRRVQQLFEEISRRLRLSGQSECRATTVSEIEWGITYKNNAHISSPDYNNTDIRDIYQDLAIQKVRAWLANSDPDNVPPINSKIIRVGTRKNTRLSSELYYRGNFIEDDEKREEFNNFINSQWDYSMGRRDEWWAFAAQNPHTFNYNDASWVFRQINPVCLPQEEVEQMRAYFSSSEISFRAERVLDALNALLNDNPQTDERGYVRDAFNPDHHLNGITAKQIYDGMTDTNPQISARFNEIHNEKKDSDPQNGFWNIMQNPRFTYWIDRRTGEMYKSTFNGVSNKVVRDDPNMDKHHELDSVKIIHGNYIGETALPHFAQMVAGYGEAWKIISKGSEQEQLSFANTSTDILLVTPEVFKVAVQSDFSSVREAWWRSVHVQRLAKLGFIDPSEFDSDIDDVSPCVQTVKASALSSMKHVFVLPAETRDGISLFRQGVSDHSLEQWQNRIDAFTYSDPSFYMTRLEKTEMATYISNNPDKIDLTIEQMKMGLFAGKDVWDLKEWQKEIQKAFLFATYYLMEHWDGVSNIAIDDQLITGGLNHNYNDFHGLHKWWSFVASHPQALDIEDAKRVLHSGSPSGFGDECLLFIRTYFSAPEIAVNAVDELKILDHISFDASLDERVYVQQCFKRDGYFSDMKEWNPMEDMTPEQLYEGMTDPNPRIAGRLQTVRLGFYHEKDVTGFWKTIQFPPDGQMWQNEKGERYKVTDSENGISVRVGVDGEELHDFPIFQRKIWDLKLVALPRDSFVEIGSSPYFMEVIQGHSLKDNRSLAKAPVDKLKITLADFKLAIQNPTSYIREIWWGSHHVFQLKDLGVTLSDFSDVEENDPMVKRSMDRALTHFKKKRKRESWK